MNTHPHRILHHNSKFLPLQNMDHNQNFDHKNQNILSNTVLLNQELREQSRKFLEELSIRPYISGKPMVREFRDGMLMDHLFTAEAKASPDDWF